MTMANKAAVIPAVVEQVRRRLERWREGRERGEPIPEALWGAAVELARECGIHRTAAALQLNYYSLKKRVELAGTERALPVRSPGFVELVGPTRARAGYFTECSVEFENGLGAKMRVHLRGADTADLVALSRTFWSAGE